MTKEQFQKIKSIRKRTLITWAVLSSVVIIALVSYIVSGENQAIFDGLLLASIAIAVKTYRALDSYESTLFDSNTQDLFWVDHQ